MLGFRVWDVENKRFIREDRSLRKLPLFWIDMDGDLACEQDQNGPRLLGDESQYIAMQSTGIKDIEGTMIYENDIYQYLNPDLNRASLRKAESLDIVKDTCEFFKHYRGVLSLMIQGTGNQFTSAQYHSQKGSFPCVIIGNILENPDIAQLVPDTDEILRKYREENDNTDKF